MLAVVVSDASIKEDKLWFEQDFLLNQNFFSPFA